MLIIAVIICCAILIGTVGYDLFKNRSEYDATTIAMGTVINIKLFGSDGEKTASEIESKIGYIEKKLLSRNVSDSDIGRINSAGEKSVNVNDKTSEIISRSLKISSDCGGVFDISIGNITKLWDFGGENQRVPGAEEINSQLPFVSYKAITVNGNAVKIGNGQSLDLGAVGKGVACDEIKDLLSKTKTKSAVISVGGSLLIYGESEYKIGIINPGDDSKSMGTLKLSDTCVSTSGNYEKTFTQDGITYHHILDAGTGYPAESDLTSVTVVCKSGLDSDALSTSCYILGYESSLSLLKKYDADAVFVYKDKTVAVTDGLKEAFSITDNSFKVK